ncbi:hypothetical protein VTL71DRAFT_13928 [Oculimacula yallundae]|uniref:Uncharacterized protein n=1 Tax=Oculimacula yallundae TaxID=86028 RepID=A0ABR4CMC7_9HELO
MIATPSWLKAKRSSLFTFFPLQIVEFGKLNSYSDPDGVKDLCQICQSFRPNRVSSDTEDSSSSDEERILPPGTPYLTKINGKLVWARKKTPKPVNNPVQDLLGEAFGSRAVIVRRRSRSLERPATRVDFGNGPPAQPQQIAYSAPLPQQAFPAVMPPMAHYPHHPPQFSPQFPPHFQLQPTPHSVQQSVQKPPHPLRVYIPQQPPAPAPLFVQRSPTEKEKEQLKVFDAHFNQSVRPHSTRVTSASSEESQGKEKDKLQEKTSQPTAIALEESSVKVKIAVTKHVCGDCGRLRSRKYHHDHPLKPGEIPEVAFCRKCQKDVSSTSESSDTEVVGKVKTSKKKVKKSKKAKKAKPEMKPLESSDDGDQPSEHPEPGSPKSHGPDQPKPNLSQQLQPTVEQAPAEEYIIVEEEFSDHERQTRGRSKSRLSKEHEARRRPLSPITSQLSAPRSRSNSYIRPSPYEYSRNAAPPVEIHEGFRDTIRRKSPRIQYRYVEVVPNHDNFKRKEPPLARKGSIRFVDEIVYEKEAPLRQYQESGGAHGTVLPYQAYSADEPESVARSYHARDRDFEDDAFSQGPLSSRQDNFDVHEEAVRVPTSRHNSLAVTDTVSSLRSSDARRRRRRERAPPGASDTQPWEQPHVIHPESDDEVVVVTETFEYRKRKPNQDEEERRKQEYLDRATMSPRRTSHFSVEEAASYYEDDWSKPEAEFTMPSIIGKPYQAYQSDQPSNPKKGYRRDRHPDSEPTESEASSVYTESARRVPPRSPSPRSSSYSPPENNWSGIKHTNWGDESLHPSVSGSEHARRQERASRSPPVDNPRRRPSNSTARPAFVREATDGGTEKTLVLSPRLWSARSRDAYDDVSESDFSEPENRDDFDDYSISNVSDAEREAEAEGRHVTFRDTPSLRSVRDNWTASENHSQRSRSEYDNGSREGRKGGSDWEEGDRDGGDGW